VELVRTERLALRRWEETDAAAFFDIYSRDDVVRWLGPRPRRAVASAEQALKGLRRWRDMDRELEPPLGFWAIVPDGSAPAGTIALLPLEEDDGEPAGLIEVAWHLHPDQQGRGLATEAAAAVLAAAGAAGIEEVLAITDLDNARSQAVAVRLGMRDEGSTDRWLGLTMRQYRITAVAGS
jgi:RimJ/RimL family protein N-acetyltransferase